MDSRPLFAELDVTFLSVSGATEIKSPEGALILCGDAAEALRALPACLADTIVTSPPYFGQRDYGVDGQIGNEQNADGYVERLVAVFRESRRVLRDDGTLWLNLGDKYVNGELTGMPWRVALALKADGWSSAGLIIWHKSNAMPTSVKNRPTHDHEYLFLLSRSARHPRAPHARRDRDNQAWP